VVVQGEELVEEEAEAGRQTPKIIEVNEEDEG
jgi:hypothetical protein